MFKISTFLSSWFIASLFCIGMAFPLNLNLPGLFNSGPVSPYIGSIPALRYAGTPLNTALNESFGGILGSQLGMMLANAAGGPNLLGVPHLAGLGNVAPRFASGLQVMRIPLPSTSSAQQCSSPCFICTPAAVSASKIHDEFFLNQNYVFNFGTKDHVRCLLS